MLAAAADREITAVEGFDPTTLHQFFNVEQFIPYNVFFTVELAHPTTMGVVNSKAERKAR